MAFVAAAAEPTPNVTSSTGPRPRLASDVVPYDDVVRSTCVMETALTVHTLHEIVTLATEGATESTSATAIASAVPPAVLPHCGKASMIRGVFAHVRANVACAAVPPSAPAPPSIAVVVYRTSTDATVQGGRQGRSHPPLVPPEARPCHTGLPPPQGMACRRRDATPRATGAAQNAACARA